MKYYENITTDEVVDECDAEDYVLDKLGIKIEPKGPNGTKTLEQIEFIENTVEWFFSGNWVKRVERDDDEPDLEYLLEMEDRRYQDELDKKWGVAQWKTNMQK